MKMIRQENFNTTDGLGFMVFNATFNYISLINTTEV